MNVLGQQLPSWPSDAALALPLAVAAVHPGTEANQQQIHRDDRGQQAPCDLAFLRNPIWSYETPHRGSSACIDTGPDDWVLTSLPEIHPDRRSDTRQLLDTSLHHCLAAIGRSRSNESHGRKSIELKMTMGPWSNSHVGARADTIRRFLAASIHEEADKYASLGPRAG
jgi:hypothetical protein